MHDPRRLVVIEHVLGHRRRVEEDQVGGLLLDGGDGLGLGLRQDNSFARSQTVDFDDDREFAALAEADGFGAAVEQFFPTMVADPRAYVLIGMAGGVRSREVIGSPANAPGKPGCQRPTINREPPSLTTGN